MKKVLFVASLALIISACASTQSAMAPTPENAVKAIAAAKAAKSKAAAVGYEWRDTGKIIASAEKALKANDEAKAIKLAVRAQRQSENALQQQAEQDEAVKQY